MNTKSINAALAMLVILLASCSTPTASSIPSSGGPLATITKAAVNPVTQAATPTTTLAIPATVMSLPSATATVLSVTPTATPNFTNPSVVALASHLPEPDDLLVGPDGTIYVSDVTEGTVRRMTGNDAADIFLSGISEPEGMALLADGSMLIVEQGRNRLLRWDPHTQALTPLLSFANSSGRLGVDGIALDARPGSPTSLIIPDSPNDRLLRVTLDGNSLANSKVTTIARRLVRPTGAWVEADGSILVVEENGGYLDRVHPDGQVERLVRLPTPDDVVEDADGNIFVTTLGDGALHWIDGKTLQDHLLVRGLSSPQGLAIDSAGNLIVTDPGNHRVVKIMVRP